MFVELHIGHLITFAIFPPLYLLVYGTIFSSAISFGIFLLSKDSCNKR
jgi:hypothetical protein